MTDKPERISKSSCARIIVGDQRYAFHPIVNPDGSWRRPVFTIERKG